MDRTINFSAFPECHKFLSKNGLTIYATKEAIQRDEKIISEGTKTHRIIQNIVAISALKNVVIVFLTFKYAVRSWLAKGDDKVIFDKINYAINQCGQAMEGQSVEGDYQFSKLVTFSPSVFQLIFYEAMEHFIEALQIITQCITGRTGLSSSTIETVSQSWRWVSWKQIGVTALGPLSTVSNLIEESRTMFSEDLSIKENSVQLDSLLNISKCFQSMIGCFINETYPTSELVLGFFENDSIIKKDILKKLDIDKNPNQEKMGYLTSVFNGILW